MKKEYKINRILKPIIIIVLLANPVFSFSQLKILGKIVNQKDEPLIYATINLLSEDKNIIKTELSDENGNFIIEEKQGNYILKIYYFGNTLLDKNINLTKDTNIGIIKLDNSLLLDEVVISSSNNIKIKKELGKYVIKNIDNTPYTKNKAVIDFIKQIPIINYKVGENTISILNKGEATINIDGKDIDKTFAMNILKSMPSNSIKQIEIITSPDSKHSASNKNGIINIITHKKENDGFKGGLNTGISQSFYNSQSIGANLSYNKNKLSVSTNMSLANSKTYSKLDGKYKYLKAKTQTEINSSSVSKYNSMMGNINFSYDINNNHKLGVQFYASGNKNNNSSQANNNYRQIGSPNLDSSYISSVKAISPNFSGLYYGNINYNIKTDTLGSNIDFSLSRYLNNSSLNTYNIFDKIVNEQKIQMHNFLQSPKLTTKIGSISFGYSKIFNADNKFYAGAGYTDSEINNDLFYGNFDGTNYISDDLQSNTFKYKDYILSGYISYEKVFNETWEGKLGFRLENYDAKGETNKNNNTLNFNNTYLFPSFTILFMPHDDHELSLDIKSSIKRPGYYQLNPFISYTSHKSYKANSPNLKPCISHDFSISYSFFQNYILDVEYNISKDAFNEFSIVLPDNWVKTVTANYGNRNDFDVYFAYYNFFFNKRWKFSTSLDFSHSQSKGSYENTNMSYIDNSYGIGIKNLITLNKKQDFFLECKYNYMSDGVAVMGKISKIHSFQVSLSKSYRNFDFDLGAYGFASGDMKFTETKEDYSFTQIRKKYSSIYLQIHYVFGNRKVKNVNRKQDNTINERMR